MRIDLLAGSVTDLDAYLSDLLVVLLDDCPVEIK
ncbi:hypothetical protein FAGKG844_350039 [Frankia sp. AgKG'84/4]